MSVTQPTNSSEASLAPHSTPPLGAEALLAKLLAFGMTSSNWDAVQCYLEPHHELTALLPAIGVQIRGQFGPEAELALERYCDPEVKDEYLTLYVWLGRYGSQIMEQINTISEQFEGCLENGTGYLLITTDFRQPQGSHGV